MMAEIGLTHYLVVAAILFALGVAGVLYRRNAVGMLIGIELILNAANVNLIAFARYADRGVGVPGVNGSAGLEGQVFAIFVIILAACEAAIGLAICINIFNKFGSIDADRADTMRG
ncbi:MAG: NADH-quinone oxidoreductase subunit NuoK [Candidatus Sumerlaeaceae bacterium]|nr:NADH-quinone oxidoreductase subunit NuoK [Candidatus Sumerlaeaceae bacterium]